MTSNDKYLTRDFRAHRDVDCTYEAADMVCLWHILRAFVAAPLDFNSMLTPFDWTPFDCGSNICCISRDGALKSADQTRVSRLLPTALFQE